MATDRNDALLAAISEQLGGLAGLLADIRDRFPPSQQEGEPAVDAADQEPDVAPEPVLLEEPAAPAAPARKTAARRAPKAKTTKEAP